MAYIRGLWSECIQREQGMLKVEKMGFERLKTLPSLSKENLKTEKIIQLKITKSSNISPVQTGAQQIQTVS